ncbi:MAG: serine/threonine protein kinase, partial [Sandaracinaceae bacterium]
MLVCPLCRLSLGENETTCPRDGREGVEASAVDVPDAIRERFEIVEPYGRGDSGDLFLVDDKKSSRRGVLKLVRLPEQTTPAEKARLKRELVKQATLSHGVLTVPLATGEADGHPWVFRDWHEGVSLAVRLARGGALAVPEALMIAAQAASALDELHRAGLLHRDLKPGHIIVEPQPSGLPRVHVIDAGLPARLETGAVFDVMGTAAYLSPEQAKGKLVSFRSDLYALGCVLFEMLSGSPPFEGDVEALLAAHAKESAPTLKVEMPGAVATLLSRLLSKEPRERPFSAQQVRRALEPFLPEDPSASREATQAFDKGADSKRRVPSPKTSGTLPPPSKGKASVPPPPPSAATKPKGASVPPPPKKPGARPVKQTSKTLMGMPLSPDTATPAATSPAAPAAKVPTPNRTEELSAVDLEQAEEILKAPKLSSQALGGGLGGLDAAVKAPPKGASIPAAPGSKPPPS